MYFSRFREMDDSLKGKNVVIDISDGASDDDGHSDDDGYGDDDGYNDDYGYGVDDGLDDYRLDELTEEYVYEMIFDSDEDEERFYNAYANMGNINKNESDSSIVHPQSFTGRDSFTYYPQSFTGRDSSAYYPQSFTANGCESSVEPNLAAGWSTNPNSIQAQILGSNFGGWSTIPDNSFEG
ncbi:hypothetical protein RHMOL_Rhmol08G0170400 [Rhododendron molle]|uniref:Uncharacterized protein n=1 Tax=Rhododendron molle TaxID=49168 RepID=A0ACC0MPL6_RHOML|nr:hypothetical protein RHMOL_Rhmol08G0170400 [Rhododendron molle]